MKFALVTTAAIVAASSALAGGYTAPVVEPVPVVVEPTQPEHDWTGFYAGLQYGKGDMELSYSDVSVDVGDYSAYGVHGGYLHDFGKYVLGAELDYNKIDLDDADGDGDLVRLKGRAGLDLGRFMPYLTMGVARVSSEEAGEDYSETGFSYGIGADFAVTEKFTIGAEYTKNTFDDVLESELGIGGIELDSDLFQIRAAYHF